MTLNGQSTSSNSGIYLDSFNNNFVEGEKYAVTLTYISGTFTGTGYISIVMEIKNSSNASVSPRNNIGEYIHNLKNLGSVSSVVTITSAGAEQGTQYQFWIWFQGGASNYSFDNYKIKVNYSNVTETKQVMLGDTYGELPTPTRTGYTFLGWNGKNLLDQYDFSDTTKWQANQNVTLNQTSTYLEVLSNQTTSTPGLIYRTSSNILEIGKTYTITLNMKGIDKTIFSICAYNQTCNSISNVSTTEFTIVSTTITITDFTRDYLLICFSSPTVGSGFQIKWMQIEENNTSTEYEPYYITSDTTVVQNKNHTLTAIWQKNS